MKLSKSQRIWIGIGSAVFALAPFFIMALVMGMSMLITFSASAPGNYGEPSPAIIPFAMLSVFGMFPLMFCLMGLQFLLYPFYVYHVLKNQFAPDWARLLVILGLFFLPYVAMPVYYVIYIWPDTPPDWGVAQTGANNQVSEVRHE